MFKIRFVRNYFIIKKNIVKSKKVTVCALYIINIITTENTKFFEC